MSTPEVTLSGLPPLNALKFLRDQIEKHADRLVESLRGKFKSIARVITDLAEKQESEFTKKLTTGMFSAAEARAYLASQLLAEFEAMATLSMDAATGPSRTALQRSLDEAATVAAMDPLIAREIRDRLLAMSKTDRNNTVARSADPHVASAVLNSPAAGLGLDVSDDAKARLLANYNREHRQGLMKSIDDVDGFLTAIQEFRASVTRVLKDALRR
jgi:hypothetical protein